MRNQVSIPSAPGSISFAWRRRIASICSFRATRRSIFSGSRLSTGLQRSRSSIWATSPAWIFSKSTTISTWIQMDSLITRSVTATTPTLQAKITAKHKKHYSSEKLPSRTIRENNQHRASHKTHKFCIRREQHLFNLKVLRIEAQAWCSQIRRIGRLPQLCRLSEHRSQHSRHLQARSELGLASGTSRRISLNRSFKASKKTQWMESS